MNELIQYRTEKPISSIELNKVEVEEKWYVVYKERNPYNINNDGKGIPCKPFDIFLLFLYYKDSLSVKKICYDGGWMRNEQASKRTSEYSWLSSEFVSQRQQAIKQAKF